MPYKDREKQKDYQRIWCRLKNRGLPTAHKNRKILTTKERRKYKTLADKRWRRKTKTKALALLGNRCIFCGNSKEFNLVFHRKDGQNHNTSNTGRLVLKSPKDWAILCNKPCHTGVHFCMEKLGIKWDKIVKIFWDNI